MSTIASLPVHDWDILVIGGGITGAGILREAARMGLRALLVEQNDFASGTSSRSSKLIHGGLRYLANGQIGLTRESVIERLRLLRDGVGLIEKSGYLHAVYRPDRTSARTFELGLRIYALFHGKWRIHRRIPQPEVSLWAPGLNEMELSALFQYEESRTDDARLVLRVLREAREYGGAALNYTRAIRLLRDEQGKVSGAVLEDADSCQRAQVAARAVVNATGAWADHLRTQLNEPPKLRLLRGSHLVIPGWRLRLGQTVSSFHPENGRPLFCIPWHGVVIVGTTDVDHRDSLNDEPRISREEFDFLLAGVRALFPAHNISQQDVQAVFAGVRPVADVKTTDPAKASRERAVWHESGLLTVTGGKLTTFQRQSWAALWELRRQIPEISSAGRTGSSFDPLPPLPTNLPVSRSEAMRWQSLYGPASLDVLLRSSVEGRGTLCPGSPISFAELGWIAENESVRHLDDLLLRRVRIGLTAPQGGAHLLTTMRPAVQPVLGWSDDRWRSEAERYLSAWQRVYGVPEDKLG